MELKEDLKFYHGTSSIYNLTDFISPVTKALNTNSKFNYNRRRTAKFRVTTDLDSALYYAKKCAEDMGGEPVVFEVSPNTFTLVKVSKTEYSTTDAKIIRRVEL